MVRKTETDLLFGVLAVQTEFVDREKLLAALQEWSRDKQRPLSEVLRGQGSLGDFEAGLIDQVVARHLENHQGDASACLADTAGLAFLRDELTALGDEDVERTLTHMPVGTVNSIATQMFEGTPGPGGESLDTVVTGDHQRAPMRPAGEGASLGDALRFRPLRKHAQGGLGEVYVATDCELNREVALKEIQPRYADDVASRRRFVMEGEVTGSLEHPGVVPVYGMGAHGDGRPYYAMRFIRGDSLREAIGKFHKDKELAEDAGKRTLALQRLLRRFIEVCNAIHYAHSRGVLHRDLKPDNIMLGPYGETLVIDWGLARLFNRGEEARRESTEQSLHPDSKDGIDGTQVGRVVGTLQYMSPEQALGWHDRLRPASDVYSLGAILYAILTGESPIQGKSFDELHQNALDANFKPPREVNGRAPRALEAICLKAMSKSVTERYTSARELADDIEAYLADEPVSAWTEPFTVRAARWMRRHRTWVVGGLATLLVSLVGSLAVVGVVVAKNAEVEQQRDAAEQNLASARSAVRESLVRIAEDERLKSEGLEQLRLDLLEAPEPYYEKFLAQTPDDPQLRNEQAEWLILLATVDYETGRRDEAEKRFRRAEQIAAALTVERPSDSRCLTSLAKARSELGYLAYDVGKHAEAEVALQSALEAARLVADDPQGEVGSLISRIQFGRGRLAERQGRYQGVAASYDEAAAAQLGVVKSNPDQVDPVIELASRQNALAQWREQVGDYDEAETLYRDTLVRLAAIETRAENPDRVRLARGVTLDMLGSMLNRMGRPRAALEVMDESVAMLRELSLEHPDHMRYQEAYAQAAHNSSLPLNSLGQTAAVLASQLDVLVMHEALAGKHPDVLDYRSFLATAHLNAADTCMSAGDAQSAEKHYITASAIAEELHKQFPDNPHLSLMHGVLHHRRATIQAMKGETGDALDTLEIAIKQLADLTSKHDLIRHRVYLADAHLGRASLLQAIGRYDDALQEIDAVLAAVDELPDTARQLPRMRMFRTLAQLAAVQIHHAAGHDPQQTIDIAEKILAERRKLVAEFADEPTYLASLAYLHAGYSVWHLTVFGEAGMPEALKHFQACIEAVDGIDLKWFTAEQLDPIMQCNVFLAVQHSQQDEYEQAKSRYETAALLCRAMHERTNRIEILTTAAQNEINAGNMLIELDRPDEAIELFDAGRATAEAVLLAQPQNEQAREQRAAAFCRRAEALRDAGRHAEALQAWDAAVEAGSTYYAVYARTERAGEYAQLGQHMTAVEQVKLAMLRPEVDSTDLYNAACVFGVATNALPEDATIDAEERKRLADWYAESALVYLRKAQAAGFFDAEGVQHYRDNSAFKLMRDLEAFKKFDAELQQPR